jgi:SAM-dependent methyltransferase
MLDLPGPFFASECSSCHLLFQNPTLRPELLGAHYPFRYAPYAVFDMRAGGLKDSTRRWLRERKGYAHLGERPARNKIRRVARRLLKENLWIGRWWSGASLHPDFVKDGTVLEIACASGNRLGLLRSMGWSNLVGIELSAEAAAVAHSRGFDVRTGPVEERIEEIDDASVDAVIASMVLEHIEDPFRVVGEVARKLRVGGQFLFSTVVLDGPDFGLYREYWYNLDLPRHFTFLRKRDLRSLLGERFRIEGTYYLHYPDDYAGSARYRLRSLQSRWYDRLFATAGDRLSPLCLALAWLGLASRIAVSARRVRS